MNRIQKISLTLFITISLGLLIGITAIVMRHFGAGISKPAFIAAVAVAGSGGVISLFFKKDKGPIVSDERDKLIEKNAHLAGFGAVYLYIILLSSLPIVILGNKASIPVTWCPALLIGAGFCQAYAKSIAILVQYGWKGKDNE